MPFVPNTGAISFDNDIEDVFEDQSTPAMSLSEFYRNGTNVQTAVTAGNVDTGTVVTSGIPTSGQISFSDFRGQGYDLIVQSAVFDRNNTTTGQDFTWTVPAGVTEISAFIVGAGGGGGGNDGVSGPTSSAGGGGGSAWGYWTVTPGTSYTLRIGAGGAPGNGNTGADGSDGGDTYIKSGSTVLLQGGGGGGGISNTSASNTGGAGGTTTGTQRVGGGVGGGGGDGDNNTSGAGGGGAGGYGGVSSAKGGDGADAGNGTNQSSGQGGAGAGGDNVNTVPGNTTITAEAAGGAVGIFGQGNNGVYFGSTAPRVSSSRHGSTYSAGFSGNFLVPASGVGSVTPPTDGTGNNPTTTGVAASPGGGGGGLEDDTLGFGQKGGDGAIRIVWGTQPDGTTLRRYPSASAVSGD
jgi:hypothetical protein